MKRLISFLLVVCLLFTSITALAGGKEDYVDGGGYKPADGYTPTVTKTFNGHTYSLFLNVCITWEEAREYCISLGGHLATITSQEEHDFVSTMDNGYCHDVWIGGYRDSSFVWYWVTDEPWDYTNWQEGEPNNSSNVIGNEYCAALWPDQWNDLNSNNTMEQYGFVCEWDSLTDDGQGVPDGLDKPVDEKVSPLSVITYRGHTYKLFDNSLKWTEARAYCESLGGHLATVTSYEENDLLVELMINGSCDGYWLGAGAGSDGWIWLTGEWFYDFTNFATSVQDRYDEVHYMQISNTHEIVDNGMWFATENDPTGDYVTEDGDKYPAGSVGFICEWDDFIVDSSIEITSVKIESSDNKITIDVDYDEAATPLSFATLYNGEFASPTNIEEGCAEFDNVESDKKYVVKMFFWNENMEPLSMPILTEIYVK